MKVLIKYFAILYAVSTASISLSAEIVSLRQMKSETEGAAFLSSMQKNSDVSFLVLRSEKNKNGTYQKLQQYYKGIPVLDQIAVVATDASGTVSRLHGYMTQKIEKDITTVIPKINDEVALIEAKSAHSKTVDESVTFDYRDINKKLVIYVDQAQVAHLAYLVTFFTDSEKGGHPARPRVLVDAATGQVLKYSNVLTFDNAEATGNGGNKKTGKYSYGQQFPKLAVTKTGNTCAMKTEHVTTIDLKNQGTGSGDEPNLPADPYSFTCFDHQEREVNGAYSQINDAHFFGTSVFNMYSKWFNVNPLHTDLTLRVHYATSYENAFWDGKQMTFGDGATMFYPLAVLDVTAHEVSHGFTEFNSGLTYEGQSGGINESFSDIAGEAMEYFARGRNDFLVGAEVMKSGQALRYFKSPSQDGMSIENVSDYNEFVDVHYSSGIFNKAFYLIATATNWNTKKAFEIFVLANQKYWTASTTFKDGAAGVLDAAKDLHYDTVAVKNAFAKVGITL